MMRVAEDPAIANHVEPWRRNESGEDQAIRGCIETEPQEVGRYNREGFGIFHAVQAFNGARKLENLAFIRAWPVEIDEGDKRLQLDRILRLPLVPSWVL